MALRGDVKGIVEPGRGLGATRMMRSGILDLIRELAGFPLVPGTLNVRLPGPFNRSLTSQYLAAEEIAAGWEAETGQAGYHLARVTVAGRYRGVAMQADEPGYPADLVELMCEVHLRQTLGLTDGDSVSFSLQPTLPE